MTDTVSHLVVALDKDIRIDDVQEIKNAILMLKYVIRVEPQTTDHVEWSARARIRAELATKLWEVLYPPAKP